MTNAFPVSITKAIVQNEIATLSTEINEMPAKVEWPPKDAPNPTAVVATWGGVGLDAVDYDATIDSGKEKRPHFGELVDALGDPKRSAQERLPIYRVFGGAGYIYAASFGTATRGNRHYVAANGAQLGAQLFARSLADIVAKDQMLAADDYHLWPDVAALTRRFSHETSPDIANAALDRIFARFQKKKMWSHVWSVLPSGPI